MPRFASASLAAATIALVAATIALVAAAIALVAAAGAAGAAAAPTVTASASFVPDRLGSPTSLVYGFRIGDTSGGLPQPLSRVVAMLPAGSTIDTTGLGVCPSLSALATSGVSACPTSSLAGFGSTQVAAQLGDVVLNETAALTIFLAPSTPGHTVLDFYGDGTTPVSEQLAFTGTQEPASAPYGFEFAVNVPTIPTVPGGPDASILSLTSTIGAANVAYYVTEKVRTVVTRRIDGRSEKVTRTVTRRVLQRVKGLTVPPTCPSGGFPFALQFTFTDGSSVLTPVTIPCP